MRRWPVPSPALGKLRTMALASTSTSAAAVQPLVFGAAQRRLFGIFHPGAPGTDPKPPVLLCPAFGQEGVRAHRFMRVLAERLQRSGHAVLRFDFHGTGDALGDDDAVDLQGWQDDVLVADAELRTRSAMPASIWFGMRLGATTALLAAHRAPPSLHRLILWDAVLDGPRYLQRLRRRHVESLEASYSILPRPRPAEVAQRDPSAFLDEAIGFALPAAFRRQVEACTPQALTWPARPPSLVALCDPLDDDGRDLATLAAHPSAAGRLRSLSVQHGTDWTTDEADNTALVPAKAWMAVVQEAGAPVEAQP